MKLFRLSLLCTLLIALGTACLTLWDPSQEHICGHCNKTLYTYDEALYHNREVHKLKEVCPFCKEEITSEKQALKHIRKKHPDIPKGKYKSEGVPID